MADEKHDSPYAKFFLLPQRIILAIMGFLAILNAYTMRICISVTITQLVVPRNYTEASVANQSVCPRDENADYSPQSQSGGGKYDWSQATQGYILSAFYIGYLISHLPGGVLATKFGGKWVLSLGILSTAIFTLFTPLCIEIGGAPALIALRLLMGIGEGTTFPALSALISQWVPVRERGILGALVLGGGQVGTIVGNTASGIILANYAWPWVFYVFAILAIIWFSAFSIICYSDPGSHPFIKQKEKDYLFAEMGRIERQRNLITPWKAIFTSLPMWSLISAQIGHDWAFYVMATDLPKYMNDVLQIPVKKNGIYSSVPFLSMWVCSLLFGFIADRIINNKILNITNTRKMNTALAAFGPAIFMLAASYAGCNHLLVMICFTMCMGLMGAYYAGMKLTPIDMSPNHSGTLMAITNGIGSLTGIFAPTTVGWMTPNTTMQEWRSVFWLAFFVLSITAIMYCIWASGEVQEWDEPKTNEQNAKN